MKGKIISKRILSDDEEESVSHWFFATGYNWLNLNGALEEDIWEVSFLNDKEELLQVSYTNSEGYELEAVMTTSGEIIIKGLLSIEELVPDHDLMIVAFRDDQVVSDHLMGPYCPSEDSFFAIMDCNGKIRKAPTKWGISYCKEEEAFEIKSKEGSKSIHAVDIAQAPTKDFWQL